VVRKFAPAKFLEIAIHGFGIFSRSRRLERGPDGARTDFAKAQMGRQSGRAGQVRPATTIRVGG
jgi:hypothetical protein